MSILYFTARKHLFRKVYCFWLRLFFFLMFVSAISDLNQIFTQGGGVDWLEPYWKSWKTILEKQSSFSRRFDTGKSSVLFYILGGIIVWYFHTGELASCGSTKLGKNKAKEVKHKGMKQLKY